MLLSQQFATIAGKNATRPAFYYLDKETSYGDLRTRIARLSYLYMNELQTAKPGIRRIGFLTRNSPAVFPTLVALSNLRCAVVPLDPDAPPEVLIPWMIEAGCTHLAITSDLLRQARELLSSARLHLPILEIEKKQGGEYDTSFSPPPEQVPLDKDIVLILRSSGRTAGASGKPRLAQFNHNQIHFASVCVRSRYRLQPTDRIASTLNWSHPYAWFHAQLVPLFNGATCIVDHGLRGAELIDSWLKARPTRIISTPPEVRSWLTWLEGAGRKLPGVRSITMGIGHASPEERARVARLGVWPLECVGQVEAGWTLSLEQLPESPPNPDDVAAGMPPRAASLVGCKYKVMDRGGDEIPPIKRAPSAAASRRTGLFAVTTPAAMAGYLGREAETRGALRGSWLYTGDYATIEFPKPDEPDELALAWIGRREELWITKEGAIRSAESIDQAAQGLPGAIDAAGFLLKTSMGDSVWAIAVVRAEKSTLSDATVLAQVQGAVAPEFVPRVVAFTDAIPRDAGGMVNRVKLSSQFSGIAG